MRFIIKTAFWLGLIAFFIPSGEPNETTSDLDLFSALVGAREAISDIGGFCDRSPAACDAGREVAGFVGARISDGLNYAVGTTLGSDATGLGDGETDAIAGQTSSSRLVAQPPQMASAPAPSAGIVDPMRTAAIAAEAVRRATGLKSFGLPGAEADASEVARTPVPAVSVPASNVAYLPPLSPVFPTPAPRG